MEAGGDPNLGGRVTEAEEDERNSHEGQVAHGGGRRDLGSKFPG